MKLGVTRKLLLMFIISILLTSNPFQHVGIGEGSLSIRVYVDPPLTVKDKPPVDFNINITVADVPSDHGVYSWESKLTFDPNILYTTTDWAFEGDFLSNVGSTYFSSSKIAAGSLLVSCMLLEPVAATGSGTLAKIQLRVVGTGKCALHLDYTKLYDVDLVEIDHEAEDGSFYTTYPKASFIYYTEAHPSPAPGTQPTFSPVVGETITFNATFISYDGTYGGSYDPDTMTIGDPDGNITSYSWSFDDGNTTSVPDPIITHVYDTTGSYSVNLTVTDNEGRKDSEQRSVTVVNHDIAVIDVEVHPTIIRPGEPTSIGIKVLNEGTEHEFFNVTCYYDNTAIWYNKTLNQKAFSSPFVWDPIAKMFGIALEPGENMTVNFTWNTTGVVEGTYDILANAGLVDSTAKFLPGEIDMVDNNKTAPDILVTLGAPIANFTFSPKHPVVDETVNFDASASDDPNGTIVSYEWNFDDGATGSGVTTTHAYATAGMYTVTLTVTDNDGLTNSAQASVTVSAAPEPPAASFTWSPSEPVIGEEITFTSTSIDPDGTVVIWEWDFNDDGIIDATTEEATWTYDAAGTYTVTLTVTDSDELEDTTTNDVTVSTPELEPPIASFTHSPTEPRIGDIVTFNASASHDPDGTIVGYDWDFGDEITGSGVTTTHAYTAPSTYTVTLTITDNDGLAGNITQFIIIRKLSSSISITASPTTLTVGESTTISGSITPTRVGATVTILYRTIGGTWGTLAVVITNANSQYSYTWKPTTSGTFELKAEWLGDANTLPDESDVQTIKVLAREAPNIFGYVVAGLAIVRDIAILLIAAILIYFVKFKKA